MSNRFYTILIVPEKTQRVKKVVIPSLLVKGFVATATFLSVLGIIMILDYANVMSQITENKKLKVENRHLRESIQVFKDKVVTIDNTLDRVKTFATKLRIITNIEDSGNLQNGQGGQGGQGEPNPVPNPVTEPPMLPAKNQDSTNNPVPDMNLISADEQMNESDKQEEVRSKRKNTLFELLQDTQGVLPAVADKINTESESSSFVKKEFDKLDMAYEQVNIFATQVETEIQHILEKISEKRTIIAGTPTRMPTLGYVTSEYGVRINPYEGHRKMHEGIDIANRFGADVIAPANGFVSFAGTRAGYGKIVIVDHGNGLETYYAHLSRYSVKDGSRVRRGQVVGGVGNSGHSTGPHLHYEVRANGLPVDPCWYILDQPTACRSR